MTDIHPRLLQDCVLLGRFKLCHLLVMQDANYPWFILVPDRDGASEIYQLAEPDQMQLMKESAILSRGLQKAFGGDKLNVAALGNIVPQLHLHHVVRFRSDAAWPAPVWGKLPALPYETDQLQGVIAKLKPLLDEHVEFCI
ncbi:MAG: HIT domain-containing protein [Acidiferrobacterales bacterium]